MKKIILIFIATVLTKSAAAAPMPWVCRAEIAQEVSMNVNVDGKIVPVVVVVSKSNEDYSIRSHSVAINDAFNLIVRDGLYTACHGPEFLAENGMTNWPYFAVWTYTNPETNLTSTCSYICQDLELEKHLPNSNPWADFQLNPAEAAKSLSDFLIHQAEHLANDFLERLF